MEQPEQAEQADAGAATRLFGAVAVERGYATPAQVVEALRAQYMAKVVFGKHLFVGEVLLLQGVLDEARLAELVHATQEMHEEAEDVHGRRFFGDVAVELGYVTPAQLLEALDLQRREDEVGERHRLIGEILFDSGRLTADQLHEVVTRLVDRMQEPLY